MAQARVGRGCRCGRHHARRGVRAALRRLEGVELVEGDAALPCPLHPHEDVVAGREVLGADAELGRLLRDRRRLVDGATDRRGRCPDDHAALVHQAVRLNIRASANHLRHGSEILEQLIKDDGLLVVGAEYSLETGVVDFFDGLP